MAEIYVTLDHCTKDLQIYFCIYHDTTLDDITSKIDPGDELSGFTWWFDDFNETARSPDSGYTIAIEMAKYDDEVYEAAVELSRDVAGALDLLRHGGCCYPDVEAFARSEFSGFEDIDEWWVSYVDFEKMGMGLLIDYAYHEFPNGSIVVFDRR